MAGLQFKLQSARLAETKEPEGNCDQDLEKSLKSAIDQLTKLQEELNCVSLERSDYKARYNSALKRLEAVEEEDNDRGEQLDELRFQLEKVKMDLSDKIAGLERVNEELKAIAEAEKSKTFEFTAFQIKYQSEHERLVKLESQTFKKGAEIDYLKGQLSLLQIEMDRKLSETEVITMALRKDVAFEKAANELSIERLRAAENKITTLEYDAHASKQETLAKVAELSIAHKKIIHLENELSRLHATLQEKDVLLDEIRELLAQRDKDLTATQRSIEKLLAREESLSRELVGAEKEIAKAANAKNALETEILALKNNLADREGEILQLKAQLHALTQQLDASRESVDDLEAKLKQSTALIDTIRAERDQLKTDKVCTYEIMYMRFLILQI